MTQIDHCSFGPASKTARPSYSPRALPHPGHNLGLGRQSRAGALARLGRGLARSCSAVGSHSTVTRRLRGVKTTLGSRWMETLGHLLRPSLSLFAAEHNRPSESEQRPWRRRRPPRRRACSPTGEHAAVERPGRGVPLPSPESQLPGSSSSPAPAKVGPSPFSLLPRPFSLLGLTRGGDGVKIRVRVSLFDSILPIRFSVL